MQVYPRRPGKTSPDPRGREGQRPSSIARFQIMVPAWERFSLPTRLLPAEKRELMARPRDCFLYEIADPGGYSGRFIEVGGRSFLNFGSYDYVGLARSPELAEGARVAIERDGVQFPFPRALLGAGEYAELRALIEAMTERCVVIAPSTTLAHFGALPCIVEEGDAVLVEYAAHPSLHAALALVPGVPLETVSGDLRLLEEALERRAPAHRRVWYVLDGIDPLTGRRADLLGLSALLERFPSLHLYVDDAHATSWFGKHGRGPTLARFADHARVLVALSLNKAFSAAGAALSFPSREWSERVEHSAGMLLSGAIPPPMLGAAVASARLHLAPDFLARQERLMARIRWVIAEAATRRVPLADTDETPIFFLPCGTERRTRELLETLRNRGIYAGAVVPPFVDGPRAGVRFMVSVHNEREDVERLITSFADVLAA